MDTKTMILSSVIKKDVQRLEKLITAFAHNAYVQEFQLSQLTIY